MVLLAAAICNKAGKSLVSRQFVEMTRSRIEGLLAAFPKLMTAGKQHTFVETESVRYVYQPLEKLYVVLVTTKASNILEDLETLRLFGRVIPEYCRVMEEADILEKAFELLFAFDEIVALGYRESVNLAQIKTFTEMDSHEEKVHKAVMETQMKEAKDYMKKKAKELQQQRREANRRGGPGPTGGYGGFGSSSVSKDPSVQIIQDSIPSQPSKPAAPSRPLGGGHALKLGSKAKDVDSFVDQLVSEGQHVESTKAAGLPTTLASKAATPAIDKESVHVKIEEKISLTCGRDGGLQTLEVTGMASLLVADAGHTKIALRTTSGDLRGASLQCHPNVDKKTFLGNGVVIPKSPDRPFPIKQELGILRWRLQSQDDDLMPLSINCWPTETGSGCDVNIEYELRMTGMNLEDVTISIPVPSGVGAPVVNECDGEYKHERSKNTLDWQLALIDDENKTGSMEFSIAGHPDDFFPVNVSFVSHNPFVQVAVAEVLLMENKRPVKFSSENLFYVNKYEIV